ncbi:MAG: class I SAM-dependent methyltransferase [Candidatus Woesearchaeota archaeon]
MEEGPAEKDKEPVLFRDLDDRLTGKDSRQGTGTNLGVEIIMLLLQKAMHMVPEAQINYVSREKECTRRMGALQTSSATFYNAQRAFFETFETHTNQKHRITQALGAGLRRRLPLAEIRKNGHYLKFLDIGPGDGAVSLPFMWAFKNNNVDFVIDEPNFGMTARFLMNYMLQGHNFRRLQLYNNNGGKSLACTQPEEFNFVLASHVLYYTGGLEQSVQAIHDLLAPGGVACVVLTKKDGFLHRIRNGFPQYFRDRNLCGQDVCDVLDSMGAQYERGEVASHLDVSDCICEMDPDDLVHLTIHGKNLVCFMLRTDYRFAEHDDKHDIVRFIHDNSMSLAGMPPAERKRLTNRMACNGTHLTCQRGHDFYYPDSRCPRRVAEFTDDIIWIRKPGQYISRPVDAKHRGIIREYNLEKDITCGDIMKFAEHHIAEHIESDLKGMDMGLVDAYIPFLIMDYFLGERYYYTLVWEDHPFSIGQFERGGQRLVGPKNVEKLKIVSEDNSLHHLDSRYYSDERNVSWEDTRGHPHCIEYLDDLLDTLQMHLPEQSRQLLRRNSASLRQLFGALYQRFRHYEVISVDGFSQFNQLLEQNPGNPAFYTDLSKFLGES